MRGEEGRGARPSTAQGEGGAESGAAFAGLEAAEAGEGAGASGEAIMAAASSLPGSASCWAHYGDGHSFLQVGEVAC